MLGNDLGMMWKFISSSLERITLSLIEGVTQKLHIFVACSILTWALAVPTIFMDCSLAAQTLDSVSSSRVMPTCRATS